METPPVTTIRVNLLNTTVDIVKERVRNVFREKYGSDESLHFVQHQEIPELLGFYKSPPHVILTGADPHVAKEIIVDAKCGRSILRGSHIFAPGVLAMSKHCSEGDRANIFVDLQGKCKKGSFDFKPEVKDHKLFIGIGKIIQPRFKIYGESASPSGLAIDVESTIASTVPSIGDCYLIEELGILQNLPSLIAVRALSPEPGEMILDMCSAPGHKTMHIIELMRDSGTVFALEKVAKKVSKMQQKMMALNYKSLKCFPFDSSKCINNEARGPIEAGPPFLPNTFDRVLLDAPCSGLGNRPQLPVSNKITPKMLRSYPVLQKQLFFAAVDALRPGGILVYSTCTINQSENELMVSWALEKFPNLRLEPINTELGDQGWPTTGLTNAQLQNVRRFGSPSTYGDMINDSIGFFIAKFKKI